MRAIRPRRAPGQAAGNTARGLVPATVTAATACETGPIDRQRFLALVGQMSGFALDIMKVISRWLRETNRRYRY